MITITRTESSDSAHAQADFNAEFTSLFSAFNLSGRLIVHTETTPPDGLDACTGTFSIRSTLDSTGALMWRRRRLTSQFYGLRIYLLISSRKASNFELDTGGGGAKLPISGNGGGGKSPKFGSGGNSGKGSALAMNPWSSGKRILRIRSSSIRAKTAPTGLPDGISPDTWRIVWP